MKLKKSIKLFLYLIVTIIIAGGALLAYSKYANYRERKEVLYENAKTVELAQNSYYDNSYLDVPFFCQAPLETEKNWKLHEESCEEAALLMAYLYKTDKNITKEEANTTILEMQEWQNKNFNGNHDIYAEDLAKLAEGFFGIENEDIKIIYGASLSEIKREIQHGNPVIAPVTSSYLKNPYYPYPGYHMLLVTGYTKDKIITNDNGTKRGKDYSYDNEIFEKALNDAGGDVLILKRVNIH